MPIIRIESLEDPRLDSYRDLTTLRSKQRGPAFIAEGQKLVRRLLKSDFVVESVLLEDRLGDSFQETASPETPIFAASAELLNSIVGFQFHRGVLASARRPPNPDLVNLFADEKKTTTIAVCAGVQDLENMGSIIRSAAALGTDGILISPKSADPFSRRVFRVSMATALKIPIRESVDFAADLIALREQHGFDLAATVLDPQAEQLDKAERSGPIALLFGDEANGLDPQWVELCNRRLTIRMRRGVNSMNVAAAAAVFLHHFAN